MNKPKIGHHWARRKADQVARDSRDSTETSEETIDEAFRWNQKQAKRKQQLHYMHRHDGDTKACSSHVDAVMAVGISEVPRALCLCACVLYRCSVLW